MSAENLDGHGRDEDEEFRRLRRIIATLRGPGGCPWDREQKLGDIGKYMAEECAEFTDAVVESCGAPAAAGSGSEKVCDELGDVLMNVLLAARIAEESGSFSIGDVCRTSREKLVRRHPHVFGPDKAKDADEVVVRWEKIKAEERARSRGGSPAADSPGGDSTLGGEAPSRLSGVPRSLPPLARAYKVSARAARAGFDWPDWTGPLAKLREEIGEVEAILAERSAVPAGAAATGSGVAAGDARVEEELGDVLFSVVNLCRKLGVHPDAALLAATQKFIRRFEWIERRAPDLESTAPAELDRLWNEARRASAPSSGRRDPAPQPGTTRSQADSVPAEEEQASG